MNNKPKPPFGITPSLKNAFYLLLFSFFWMWFMVRNEYFWPHYLRLLGVSDNGQPIELDYIRDDNYNQRRFDSFAGHY